MADLNMTLDRVDAQNQVIGSIIRRDVFRTQANFRVVHVFVFNSRKELLLQKIATGLRHEGQWGSSAAGYLEKGEDFTAAAARKARSELGLPQLVFQHVGTTSMDDRGCRKFIGLFATVYDGPLTLNPADVCGLEFLSLADIEDARKTGSRTFTETFLHLLDYYTSSGIP